MEHKCHSYWWWPDNVKCFIFSKFILIEKMTTRWRPFSNFFPPLINFWTFPLNDNFFDFYFIGSIIIWFKIFVFFIRIVFFHLLDFSVNFDSIVPKINYLTFSYLNDLQWPKMTEKEMIRTQGRTFQVETFDKWESTVLNHDDKWVLNNDHSKTLDTIQILSDPF